MLVNHYCLLVGNSDLEDINSKCQEIQPGSTDKLCVFNQCVHNGFSLYTLVHNLYKLYVFNQCVHSGFSLYTLVHDPYKLCMFNQCVHSGFSLYTLVHNPYKLCVFNQCVHSGFSLCTLCTLPCKQCEELVTNVYRTGSHCTRWYKYPFNLFSFVSEIKL